MSPTGEAGTPGAWRVAALTALGGGLGAGWLATRGSRARWSIAASIAVVGAYVGPLAFASRRPPITSADGAAGAGQVTFSVVVAARDEAAVIPRLVQDIAAQDHRTPDGRPLYELVVVDDRSVDGTGRAARAAAIAAGIGDITRIIRRSGENLDDGKGAALSAAHPEECRGDVVVVLDADARVDPSFLRTLGGYIAAGVDAVTVRRRVLGAGESHLAGAQADEQTLDGELQRGRWALGGCSEFRGNGITVRRSLLASVGGWRPEALTEDLDLSSRLAAAHGIRVAWALEAEVWEEPVRTWRDLWQQRVRWAEGSIRRTLEHGPRVARSTALSRAARFDFVVYTGQLAVPAMLAGAIAAAVVVRRPGPAVALIGAYGGASGILAWDALRWETATDGRLSLVDRALRTIRVTAFGALWIGAVPAALWRLGTRRGRVGYHKMPHTGTPVPTIHPGAPRPMRGPGAPDQAATPARDRGPATVTSVSRT